MTARLLRHDGTFEIVTGEATVTGPLRRIEGSQFANAAAARPVSRFWTELAMAWSHGEYAMLRERTASPPRLVLLRTDRTPRGRRPDPTREQGDVR